MNKLGDIKNKFLECFVVDGHNKYICYDTKSLMRNNNHDENAAHQAILQNKVFMLLAYNRGKVYMYV